MITSDSLKSLGFVPQALSETVHGPICSVWTRGDIGSGLGEIISWDRSAECYMYQGTLVADYKALLRVMQQYKEDRFWTLIAGRFGAKWHDSIQKTKAVDQEVVEQKVAEIDPWSSIHQVPLDGWFKKKGFNLAYKIEAVNSVNHMVKISGIWHTMKTLNESYQWSRYLKIWSTCGQL